MGRVLNLAMILSQGLSRKVNVDPGAEDFEEQLRRVTHLHLQDKGIGTLCNFGVFHGLLALYLYENEIENIAGLEESWDLQFLYLQRNKICKLEGLRDCTKLRKLYLGQNLIRVIEGLETLGALEELHIEAQRLSKGERLIFDPVTLNTLRRCLLVLDISDNGLTSLNDLAGMEQLHTLKAQGNQISKLDEACLILGTLPSLLVLDLRRNPISKDPKYKEKIIAFTGPLEILDEKQIPPSTKQFIRRFCHMKARNLKRIEESATNGDGVGVGSSWIDGKGWTSGPGPSSSLHGLQGAQAAGDFPYTVPGIGFPGGSGLFPSSSFSLHRRPSHPPYGPVPSNLMPTAFGIFPSPVSSSGNFRLGPIRSSNSNNNNGNFIGTTTTSNLSNSGITSTSAYTNKPQQEGQEENINNIFKAPQGPFLSSSSSPTLIQQRDPVSSVGDFHVLKAPSLPTTAMGNSRSSGKSLQGVGPGIPPAWRAGGGSTSGGLDDGDSISNYDLDMFERPGSAIGGIMKKIMSNLVNQGVKFAEARGQNDQFVAQGFGLPSTKKELPELGARGPSRGDSQYLIPPPPTRRDSAYSDFSSPPGTVNDNNNDIQPKTGSTTSENPSIETIYELNNQAHHPESKEVEEEYELPQWPHVVLGHTTNLGSSGQKTGVSFNP